MMLEKIQHLDNETTDLHNYPVSLKSRSGEFMKMKVRNVRL